MAGSPLDVGSVVDKDVRGGDVCWLGLNGCCVGVGVGIGGLEKSVVESVSASEGTDVLAVIGTGVGDKIKIGVTVGDGVRDVVRAGLREGIGEADGIKFVAGWEFVSGVAFSGALLILDVGNVG